MRWTTLTAVLALVLLEGISLTAFAHPADISYLRVKVQRQKLELRFTFNLLTLTRFVVVDANGDRRIEKKELDAAEATLRHYFEKHIQIRINDRVSTLGAAAPLVCVWPSPDGPAQAEEADYGQRYVDFVFVQEVKPLLEDVWLGFDIWNQTGPLGAIDATYEQDQIITKVPFSAGEPDYLHDTGFGAEPATQASAAADRPIRFPIVSAAVFVCLFAAALELWRRKRYCRQP